METKFNVQVCADSSRFGIATWTLKDIIYDDTKENPLEDMREQCMKKLTLMGYHALLHFTSINGLKDASFILTCREMDDKKQLYAKVLDICMLYQLGEDHIKELQAMEKDSSKLNEHPDVFFNSNGDFTYHCWGTIDQIKKSCSNWHKELSTITQTCYWLGHDVYDEISKRQIMTNMGWYR